MPIDPELSRYSDLAFGSALAVYVLALVLLAAELAGQRTRTVVERESARALVGSGAPVAAGGAPGRVVVDRVPTSARLGRAGLALTGLALVLNVASLALRGVSASRMPLGNMYEFISAMCAVAVLAWLVVLRRHPVRPLTVFVLLPVVVAMFAAGTVLYAQSAPVVPALQSYWLVIHVTVIAGASSVLVVSGVTSLLFVLRRARPEGNEGGGPLGQLAARLPGAQLLDRVAYRTAIFAFPLFTIGVILGAVWAEAAWGRFWGWDPKETAAFITWVVYAAYLHARATAGWRNTRAAWINVLGAATVIFNLFFINIVIAGLHSYAGLN